MNTGDCSGDDYHETNMEIRVFESDVNKVIHKQIEILIFSSSLYQLLLLIVCSI